MNTARIGQSPNKVHIFTGKQGVIKSKVGKLDADLFLRTITLGQFRLAANYSD